MKKSILALATCAAFAGSATAQSSVGMYGLLDMAAVRESGGAAGPITKLGSGVSAGSRLGFKGNEDVGGGLSALFLLESGFQADTGAMGQGGLLFGRQAYVGLQGAFGSVTIGRQYTPQYQTVAAADPFGSGTAGDSKNLMPATGNGTSRMDNAVKFASPSVGGVSGELAYAPGELAGSAAAGRQIGAALTYASGALRARLGYHHRNNDTATVKNLDPAKNAVLALTYDAGIAKAHFAYGSNKGVNSSPLRNTANPFGAAVAPQASVDSRDLMLGVSVPSGPHTALASYIRKDDRGARNQDASQFAVGYRYAVSKRTELYSVYARIENRRGAAYTVGNAIEVGTGDKALNLGIRHTF
ncbi:porin [Pseudoduganella sp. LjRoot289]|uniref:porin n=1 Tax=Pseudoduganella sp. LjRoot289 TaxID=3342314 RepID=UPI003ECE09E9